MFKKTKIKYIIMLTMVLLISLSIAHAEDKTMVGTLSATMDEQNNTVTAMFVGYCEGEPVIIGPTTWSSSVQEFSNASVEDIGNKLCGSSKSVKKITKSTKTNKDVVAEIVVTAPTSAIIVGR
ncbi:MAG: hypothetical protein HXY52_03520 [Nitrospirae bacterium]|jgi:hypothetical protein|nr:hypothetical protein [Nitrospirota bacterium]